MTTTLRSSLFLLITVLLLPACQNPLYSEPPLHDAVMRGNLKRVKSLIADGEKVDGLNREGATALHWAAFKGEVDIAKYLLSKGANVNSRTKKGNTPLKLAIDHKQEKVAEYLKRKGGK